MTGSRWEVLRSGCGSRSTGSPSQRVAGETTDSTPHRAGLLRRRIGLLPRPSPCLDTDLVHTKHESQTTPTSPVIPVV